MAVAIGSRLALKTLGASPLVIGQVTAQPPLFGVSQTAGAGPYVVDWENGTQSSVTLGVVDELFVADSATLELLGQVVNVPGYSPAYAGVVVSAYNRNGTQECVLIKTLQGGTYYEYAATAVAVVPGL